eukprot:m.5555 g.5555  ORF g.5555 m.5555 type:complete len:283 (+) comp13492_c0_seq1:3-851(+)
MLMCDALPHVLHFSKCFQFKQCDYGVIPRMLSSTVASLEQLIAVDGVNLKALPAFLEQVDPEICIEEGNNLGYDYFQNSVRKPFLEFLIQNLKERFADLPIIASWSIFNPSSLPRVGENASKEEISVFLAYGNEEIKALSSQFASAVASEDESLSEWSSFRQYMHENWMTQTQEEIISTLCLEGTMFPKIFPNMSSLAKICRVVPVHTADVERFFGLLKPVKEEFSKKSFEDEFEDYFDEETLDEQTLDALLRIATEGPNVGHFSAAEAISLWAVRKIEGSY